jgi:alkaline phosphatase D
MGDTQRDWLVNSMRTSGKQWNLVASQVMMSETDLLAGEGKEWYYDAWDGYQVERNALLADFKDVRNPVVLSGDRHRTIVSDLKLDYSDPGSTVVGAEFVGTSISSNGDEDLEAFAAEWAPKLADNPHWKMIDARRGYLLLDITPTGIDAQLRAVSTVLTKNGTTSTAATFRVDSGVPGVHRADAQPEAPASESADASSGPTDQASPPDQASPTDTTESPTESPADSSTGTSTEVSPTDVTTTA